MVGTNVKITYDGTIMESYKVYTILDKSETDKILCITHKVNNVGYTVIPMLIGIVFSMLYRNSKKAIEENKE